MQFQRRVGSRSWKDEEGTYRTYRVDAGQLLHNHQHDGNDGDFSQVFIGEDIANGHFGFALQLFVFPLHVFQLVFILRVSAELCQG